MRENFTPYRPEPDYHQPRLRLPRDIEERLHTRLETLYGVEETRSVYEEIVRLLQVFHACKTDAHFTREAASQAIRRGRLTQRDAILITYGDLIQATGTPPLRTLAEMVRTYLRDVFTTLHILPFFPSSSDRGFAVIDFKEVDPNLGAWEDILEIAKEYRLMFDGVFNHVSSRSPWFREYLDQNPEYTDFFTVFGEADAVDEAALRRLFRPRTSDVLTTFATLNGPQRVWTTFGPDQVDLKFQNPRVLLKMVEILLFYVRQGAELIRLDAVTYLWDELGSSGIHLWQTHAIIKLFRDVLDAVAPHVMLITETNVPHAENISYFGTEGDEAQMVYNFALPPLILHTFFSGNAQALSAWASTLSLPAAGTAFLNFLDSHDGIGLLGARGILTDEQIDAVIRTGQERGGLVSCKKEADGSETPYEMNIASYSALNPEGVGEPDEMQIRRYLAARAVTMTLPGVPGIYLHGLLGSRNDAEAIRRGEERRSINRRNLKRDDLFAALSDPRSLAAQVAGRISQLLRVRQRHAAFHPDAPHRIYHLDVRCFVIERTAPDGSERLLCLCNVTAADISLPIPDHAAPGETTDVLSGTCYPSAAPRILLSPYEIVWLKSGFHDG